MLVKKMTCEDHKNNAPEQTKGISMTLINSIDTKIKNYSKSRAINTNDHLFYSVSVNWILQQPKQELWFNTYNLSSFSQKTRLSNPLQTFPTAITDMRC